VARELQVLQDFYDLSTYLMGRVQKFPRSLRHGLGLSIEHRLQDLLALLVRAKYAPAAGKPPLLRDINVELEVLRFQLRQSTELKALALGSQKHALERLTAVGTQVGGWLRSLAPGKAT
jgi:hypothetical protein